MNIQDKTLRTILAEHKQWVDSNGKEGAKADFAGFGFSYVNFSDADMTNADMRYVDMPNADMTNADMRFTNMRHADMTDVDMTNVTR